MRQKLFLFPIDGAEVVLGMDWLETLEEVWANFKEATLKVDWQAKRVVLKGDPELRSRPARGGGGIPLSNPFARSFMEKGTD